MTTMRDVGAQAGVSAKTVSRVLRNDRYVTDEVRQRVLVAVSELRYVPNSMAVTFRSGQDTAIGVAVPDIADPFFSAIIQAIEREARTRGTAVIVSSLGYEAHREQEVVETLLKRQVQGLICCPVAPDQSYLRPWQKRAPMVFIDRSAQKLTADSVVEDDRGGAFAMTMHLIGHGHRRIAFLGDGIHLRTTTLRLEGYTSALVASHLEVDEELIYLEGTEGTGALTALGRLSQLVHPPTALFSSNARITQRVVKFRNNAQSPDVALVSFGDFAMAEFLQPSLTVVDQNPHAIGRAAAERLFLRIATPERRLKRRTMLPVTLVERQSCRLPATSAVRDAAG